MPDALMVLTSAITALGWVLGATLVAVAALAGRVPRYWSILMLQYLGEGRARTVVFFAGVMLLFGATMVFGILSYFVSSDF